MNRQNLLDLNRAALSRFFATLGEKPFRAQQIMHWLHKGLAVDFRTMTDLSKNLRDRLDEVATIEGPTTIRDTIASDGTRKWLFKVDDSNAIETVYIPEENRGTLCISSQAGCALDCAFCSTGKQGFNRNLTVAEIIGQLWHANRALMADGFSAPWVEQGRSPITNVVMMGMGEPLANYDNVVAAMDIMLDDHAYGLSRRRVTLSTSGVVPALDRLRAELPVALAVSLHAPNDSLRNLLVPINQKYPLATLLASCRRYLENAPRDFVTFEYVMLDGINDQPAHARELVDLIADLPCKFNLIPFNPFPGSSFRSSPRTVIKSFQAHLIDAGYITTIRRTRGDDIDAACGQLAGQVQDKTKRQSKIPIYPLLPTPPIKTPIQSWSEQ